jgi:sugar lactone lactonase YvrE
MSKKLSATLFVSGLGNDICNPFFDRVNKLHIVRQNAGSILTVDNVGNSQMVVNTGGQPNYGTYNEDGSMYVCDFGHSSVLAFTNDGQQEVVVGVYEDKPLRGPNSIAIVDEDIFFTDSGTFGETGLHNPAGSIFAICNSPSGQVLKPIALGNLAFPSGIAVTRDKKFIYVAETMTNRILRFFQQPVGVYHGSVFYQLSGGIGPMALTLDSTGNLFVGQYDLKDSTSDGHVYVVSPTGKLLKTITTNGPEISGLAIAQSSSGEETLYITERSSGSVFKFEL